MAGYGTHSYNPSYSEGRDQGDHSSRLSQVKSLARPSSQPRSWAWQHVLMIPDTWEGVGRKIVA
jgi:hypothetical protein